MSAVEPVYTAQGAEFSRDEQYRYRLWRRWASGAPGRAAIFIMLNPSTADAEKLDPTVRRCVGCARRWGCDELQVLNIFALRSTNPKALYRHPEPIGPENDAAIARVLRGAGESAIVVAAWGTHGTLAGRGMAVARWVQDFTRRLQCLGINADGTPKHPLYLRADAALRPYP